MQEVGVVVESSGGRAKIRVERTTSCRHCCAKVACQPFGEGPARLLEVVNRLGAAPGQQVVVEIEAARLVKSSLIVYGIPLVAFILGTALGTRIGHTFGGEKAANIGAIVGAAICLGLSFVIIRIADRIAARHEETLPRIVEIVETSGQEPEGGTVSP